MPKKPASLAKLGDRKMSYGRITMNCKDSETGNNKVCEVEWRHYAGGQPGMNSAGADLTAWGYIMCASNGQNLKIRVDRELEDIIYPTGERRKPSYGRDFEDALKERIRESKHQAS